MQAEFKGARQRQFIFTVGTTLFAVGVYSYKYQ
jgi:hypothetical protein